MVDLALKEHVPKKHHLFFLMTMAVLKVVWKAKEVMDTNALNALLSIVNHAMKAISASNAWKKHIQSQGSHTLHQDSLKS